MSIFREHKTIADRSASDRQRHKKKIEVICQVCKNPFEVDKPSYAEKRKYCSRSCSNSLAHAKKDKIKIECVICHNIFETFPSMGDKKYCSIRCRGTSYRKRYHVQCLTCNKILETTYAKNKKYCSKSCHHISLSTGHALENLKMTNLQKYGVNHVSQSLDTKRKKHRTMKKNKTYGKSNVENKVYDILLKSYGNKSIDRQHSINGWAIDFFIKTLNVYLQVDGIYWHGLDKPREIIESSNSSRNRCILSTMKRDAIQNKWFEENGLKLIRITDAQIKRMSDTQVELPNILEESL